MSRGLTFGRTTEESANLPIREWLNGRGEFKFGRHKGESVESVAKSDPGYLRWITLNVEDISADDREIVYSCLERWG